MCLIFTLLFLGVKKSCGGREKKSDFVVVFGDVFVSLCKEWRKVSSLQRGEVFLTRLTDC